MVVRLLDPPPGPDGQPDMFGLPTQDDDIGDKPADLVLAFVETRAAVEPAVVRALAAAAPGGLVWFAYPKKTGRIRTDINRDQGWEPLTERDWLPVTQIALDGTWSALRFRPRGEIKVLTRTF